MKKSSQRHSSVQYGEYIKKIATIIVMLTLLGITHTIQTGKVDTFLFGMKVEATTRVTNLANKKKTTKKVSKEERTLSKAETSVKYLEDHQATKNIQAAQSAVDKVTDAEQKAKFQHRIELVKNAIAQKENTKRIVAEAEQAVKYLEDNQLKDNIQKAQTAVDQVADAEQKAKFQNRIELVKNAIVQKVEQVVKKLEDNQVTGNIQPAEAALETLSDPNQKAAFQHRIELVKNAIAQREEAARQALAEQQANRTVYVTQNGTNDVYWYSMSNMPSTTRFDKVREMTEAEALAQGKHHSMRE